MVPVRISSGWNQKKKTNLMCYRTRGDLIPVLQSGTQMLQSNSLLDIKCCNVFVWFDRNDPNRDPYQSCYLNYFGAFGSGLATYDTMKWLSKNQKLRRNSFTSFCKLVHSIEKLHRPTMDSVTVVCYQLSGLTTKL